MEWAKGERRKRRRMKRREKESRRMRRGKSVRMMENDLEKVGFDRRMLTTFLAQTTPVAHHLALARLSFLAGIADHH
jgi:hypothetical protein